MAAPAVVGSVVPAQLGFLAIFSPSLGNTDETLDDQIVYYASVTSQSSPNRRRRTRGKPTADIPQEERNERLRQIGLAQGMASFSRGFAEGAALDSIDTEKSRVVMHELEPGWWILASVDLTKVPLPPRLPNKNGGRQEERYEYSSKEMKPAALLLRDLLRAHSIFLMHHDSSLSALFARARRPKFVSFLSRYWDLFLSTWNVMLHGNPIRDVFGGINLAASGELGMGVGEEERGSGEREVLEGLVGRIEGLVDLVVSKFGTEDDETADSKHSAKDQPEPWLGTGREPGGEDGAIFLGAGALSKNSLRDLTHWMEDIYTWGEHAYGVIDSPTSVRRAKARKAIKEADQKKEPKSSTEATKKSTEPQPQPSGNEENPDIDAQKPHGTAEDGKLETMVSYLKLGYGSYWTIPGVSGDSSAAPAKPQTESPEAPEATPKPQRPSLRPRKSSTQDAAGHYLIGLKGEIEEGQTEAELSADSDESETESNSRTVLRTVNVELEGDANDASEDTIIRDFQHPGSVLTQSQVIGNMVPGYNSHDLNKAEKLRVVVYVNRPFIFTFLFRLRTDSLAWDSLYRSLHYQLAPLRKPLIASTSYRPERPDSGRSASSIYDFIWDPSSLTIQSTIPNIPETYEPAGSGWSRLDAVNTHLHLLNTYSVTRSRATDLERTQKTNRGWWIVWTRLMQRHGDLSSSQNLATIRESSSDNGDAESLEDEEGRAGDDAPPPVVSKEIFLLRRASDHTGYRGSLMEGSGGGGDAPAKLAQGIGVDTRRYVEELLTLL